MKYLKLSDGFSLIEVMVTVAIIGVLATIAIPQYSSFKRKAMQAEAKTLLSGIYATEMAFINEWEMGTVNLKQLGFEMDQGDITYMVGWNHAHHGRSTGSTFININVTSRTNLKGYRGPLATSANRDIVNTHKLCPSCVRAGADKSATNIANAIEITNGWGTRCSVDGHTAARDRTACQGAGGTWNSRYRVWQKGAFDLRNYDNGYIQFTMGAIGNLGGDINDEWILDHNKNLENVKSGI